MGKEKDVAGRRQIWREGERYGRKGKDMAGRRKIWREGDITAYVPTYSYVPTATARMHDVAVAGHIMVGLVWYPMTMTMTTDEMRAY